MNDHIEYVPVEEFRAALREIEIYQGHLQLLYEAMIKLTEPSGEQFTYEPESSKIRRELMEKWRL